MAAFIVRRLLAAVILLVVVSMMTFAIFFLVPRLAGMNSDQLALRYVGRGATAESIQATKERLHLDDPLPVQYGRFVQGIVVGDEFNYGPETVKCPPPCFGYSFRNSQPVTALLLDRIPVTASLAFGAAILWLVGGVSVGVLSALRRGSVFDRVAMTHGARRRLAAHLLHRPALARALRVPLEAVAERRQLRAVHRRTRSTGPTTSSCRG